MQAANAMQDFFSAKADANSEQNFDPQAAYEARFNLTLVHGGRYYERPLHLSSGRTRPVFAVVDRDYKNPKDTPALTVGYEHYRFSQTGAVELTRRVHKAKRPITDEEAAERKRMKLGPNKYFYYDVVTWWVTDIADGRRTELTQYLAGQLSTGYADLPGYGWCFLATPDANRRLNPRNCDKCGEKCKWHGGDGPTVGGKRPANKLLPGEWAEIQLPLDYAKLTSDNKYRVDNVAHYFGAKVIGAGHSSVRCAKCLPIKYVWCDYCRVVHNMWVMSPLLAPYKDLLTRWQQGTLPRSLKERVYETGKTDKETGKEEVIVKPEHPDVRITDLVYLVGRATLCRNPAHTHRDNLKKHLKQLDEWAAWLVLQDG